MKEGRAHPDVIVESALLACVSPPDITYEHHLQVRHPLHGLFKCVCDATPSMHSFLIASSYLHCGQKHGVDRFPVQDIVEEGLISDAQLEAVVYANMRFGTTLSGRE